MNQDISNVGKITGQNILKKYREKKNSCKSSWETILKNNKS